MPRKIVIRQQEENGVVQLVSDPHDESNKERWYVETQIRFSTEADAREFFTALLEMARAESSK